MIKKYIVYIKSVFLLSLVVFLYGFSAQKNNRRKITDLEIEFSNGDNLFMTHEMVNKLLIQKNESVKNKAKSLINLHKFERSVAKNPLVEEAKVYMTIAGSLKTVVTQRTPIGRVNTGIEGYYIDKQGLKMPLSVNYSARVPLVSGQFTDEDIPAVFLLLKKINSEEFLTNLIVGIHKASNGDYLLMTRIYDQEIRIGAIVGLDTKLKKLLVFYQKAIKDEAIENYKTIDLKYDNQVVCTKN
jgi:cell division protein FtsQ